MKKITALFLLACLMLALLPGCSAEKPDVWDGTVAESFSGGDGTADDPYTVTKASQLALLAAEINAGKDYTGKHVSLDRDLDLAMLDWTPIGNGTYSFNGTFNGNGHTITNLKITQGAYYTETTAAGTHARQYTIGLFGSCYNATVQGLSIDKADITVPITGISFTVTAGVLAGTARADEQLHFSDIHISRATITPTLVGDDLLTNLRIGGAIGSIQGNKQSSCTVERVQADVQTSIRVGQGRKNHIGGIIGHLHIKNSGKIANCASYLSVDIDADTSFADRNTFGALGYLGTVYHSNTISVSGLFSRVAVHINHQPIYINELYTAHAIVGELDTGYRGGAGYQFKDLYGYVEEIDDETGRKEPSMQLYYIQYPDYPGCTAVNCLGCDTLPKEHGLDEGIWDLRDPSRPVLK